MLKIQSQKSSVIVPSRAYFAIPAFANTTSSLFFSCLTCAKRRVQIVELRGVALHTGYTSTDFLYCLGQLWFAAAGDEHVRALVHKPLRRTKTNPAGASGYKSNLSVEFAHMLISPCKPVSLTPRSLILSATPCAQIYASATRVSLTYFFDQRAPRTRHDPRERTCLFPPVVSEAQAGLQEPSCTACIRRIQALRI